MSAVMEEVEVIEVLIPSEFMCNDRKREIELDLPARVTLHQRILSVPGVEVVTLVSGGADNIALQVKLFPGVLREGAHAFIKAAVNSYLRSHFKWPDNCSI